MPLSGVKTKQIPPGSSTIVHNAVYTILRSIHITKYTSCMHCLPVSATVWGSLRRGVLLTGAQYRRQRQNRRGQHHYLSTNTFVISTTNPHMPVPHPAQGPGVWGEGTTSDVGSCLHALLLARNAADCKQDLLYQTHFPTKKNRLHQCWVTAGCRLAVT